MNRRLKFVCVLVAALIGLSGQAFCEPQKRAWVFALPPSLPAKEMIERFRPLAEHLGRSLDEGVRLVISRDYRDHVSNTGRDLVDISFMGPVSYVQLVEQYGPKPLLAQLEVSGQKLLRSHIVVAESSPILKIEDLVGRSFAFADPASTAGNILPRYMLIEAGVPLQRLGQYRHIDHHDNVALTVLAGRFEAGGVKDETYERMKSRGLRSIAVSQPVSQYLFVASKRLAPGAADKARAALLALSSLPEGKAVLGSIQRDLTGLVPVQDSDYDPLRKILDRLKREGAYP